MNRRPNVPRVIATCRLSPEKCAELAEAIRQFGTNYAIKKLGHTRSSVEFVHGEMLLGRYGGMAARPTSPASPSS